VVDVLLRPSDQISKRKLFKKLERKLTAEGFQKYETILGADGVGVLWPAMFQNSTDGMGEDINQEMFENADDVQGIDELVEVGVQ